MIVVIVGPTGVGKTKLSLALAKHFNTELISGDSVQVYKGLDIGSAKVTKAEQAEVKHHMIDILEPDEPFSVAAYQRLVRWKIADFNARGKRPIIVGGTGFYINSVLHDFDFNSQARDDDFEASKADVDNETLFNTLKALDPDTAKKLHANNRKRVLLALKRALDGELMSQNKNQHKKLYDYCIIALSLDRETLYERINQRVELMFEQGLLDEVKNLYDQQINSNATTAIGYKELYGYFNGEYDLEEAKRLIKRNSRRYAKKQFTYFNNQLDVHWVNANLDNFNETINDAIKIIEETI